MKAIAYYPGCSLEGLAKEFDDSTREVFNVLGIQLIEIPDWNCCGSTPARINDPLFGAALAGRNLAIAESLGLDAVMTPCPGCLKALKEALKTFENPSKKEAFLEILGRDFKGKVKVVSVLQYLYEKIGIPEIEKNVVNPLEGLVVIPYYGCLLSRPPSFANFDDPENPISMDKILSALGATVPDFPFKTECCGATYGVVRNEVVGRLSGRILDMAKELGGDVIAVACPLCQQNLDLRQEQIERYQKKKYNIPILYITQLIGLAFGCSPKKLGLDKLVVKPLFLEKRLFQQQAG